jgi:hypothetical protein
MLRLQWRCEEYSFERGMGNMLIDVPEDTISCESLLIHHTERLQDPHLEYRILRYTHLLCLPDLDAPREIIVESLRLLSLYPHLSDDMDRLEKCYDPIILPSFAPSMDSDIETFQCIFASFPREEYLSEISDIDPCDIFFAPPCCDLAVFSTQEYYTSRIVSYF